MPTPTLTTKLDAVNVVLSAAGESPVNALGGTTADAANAESLIDEMLREVLSEGWHFNTDEDVPLTPDVSTKLITLPSNVVKIDTKVEYAYDVDVVQRGSTLYDRKNRTDQFKAPILADVTYLLSFEQLPEQARRYISMRASRVFHDRFVGSEVEHRFTAEDEARARAALTSSDLDSADINIFRSNPAMSWMASRR